MKLLGLKVFDFKKVHVAELQFRQGSLVEIAGRNGEGKTSILDALAGAFGGPAAIRTTEEPIRKGAKRAEVVAETDELTVRRVWTPSGQTVKVTAKNGTVFSRPQEMLDRLLSSLSFDPLAFVRARKDDRRMALIDALGLGPKLDAIEERRRAAYAARAEANRDCKRYATQLESMPAPLPDAPTAEVSAVDVLARLKSAREANDAAAAALRTADAISRDVDRDRLEVKQLEHELDEARQALRKREADLKAANRVVAGSVTLDVEPIEAELAGLETTNRLFREARDYGAARAALEGATDAVAIHEAEMAAADAEKAGLLVGVDLPVEGLTLGDDDIELDGLPFDQASTADQVAVSTAIAMALKPELRVLRVAEGSLLDSESLTALRELAVENDFVLLVEKVRDEPTGGVDEIFIVDGAVLSDDEDAAR